MRVSAADERPEPEAAAGALAVPCFGEALFDFDYGREDEASARLYAKTVDRHWSIESRLDWSQGVDPANPLGFDDRLLPLHGSPLWQRLAEKERAQARFEYHTYWVSQILHGEQAALLAAGRLVALLPDLPAKRFAAVQAVDEARHVALFERLLRERLGELFPLGSGLKSIIEQGLGDRRWDMVVLGTQVVVEGMTLSAFQQFRDASRNPFIQALNAYVLEDEARHVAFGLALLPRAVARLSGAERREREEYIIESVAALSARSSTRAVWERANLPAGECMEWVDRGRHVPALSAVLLRRIPPILQRVGLWSERVAAALAKMNLHLAKGVDLDAWMRGDEKIAARVERRASAAQGRP
jgi:hypothetical protein